MSLATGCRIVEAREAALDLAEQAIRELRERALPSASEVDACAMALRCATLNLTGAAKAMRDEASSAVKTDQWWKKEDGE